MSVLATIEPTELSVDPGAEASLLVRVRNRGTIVDRFDIAVVGPTAAWATVDQPSLRLFPDKEGEARVWFRPPRAADPAADTYPCGISVRAASDANASTVEEGRVTVAPFVQLTTQIVPQTSRGSRVGSHDVTVHNVGNAVAEVSVKASDPDALMTFELTPERSGLRPDAKATIRARAKPKQTFLFGSPKRLPFSIDVAEPTAGSYPVLATMEQRAIVPSWVKPAAGLIAAGIAAILILPPMLGLTGASPSPSTAAVATETPAPITEPPATPTEAPPATDAPTPTPPLGPPDALTIAGDDTGLAADSLMTMICTTANEGGCRDRVKDRIITMLGNLQGPAQGARLVSFTSSTPGTLPVTASWSDWHYPYASISGPTGDLTSVSIDLAPILVGSTAYALVQDERGSRFTFAIPAADAQLLFDDLYTIAMVAPTPEPDGGGGTIFLGDIYARPIGDVLLRDYIFVPQFP